jgi:hypothetical protein
VDLAHCFIGLTNIVGKPFKVETVTRADAQAGILKTSWVPAFSHPNIDLDKIAKSLPAGANAQEVLSKAVVTGGLLSNRDAWDVSDEWNKLLPQLKLTGIEKFLTAVWKDKE